MMKQMRPCLILFGLFGILQVFWSPRVEAHGTAHRVIRDAKTITVEFYYADKEPMRYAEVLVFSPSDQKIEYQNGRTDQNGRFAFYPETAGAWRIEVSDGMGHKEVGRVVVGQADNTDADPGKHIERSEEPDGSMRLLKAVLGISLIFNIAFFYYAWKTRRRGLDESNI